MTKYITILFILLSIISCKAKKLYPDYNVYTDDNIYQEKDKKLSGSELISGGNIDKNNAAKFDSRKIVYNAFVTLVVNSPDSANIQLVKIAEKFQGYIQQSNNRQTIIRVKSEYLNDALSLILKLGKVQNKSIESEDITDYYKDLQIQNSVILHILNLTIANHTLIFYKMSKFEINQTSCIHKYLNTNI